MLRFSANLSLLFTDLPLQDRFAAAKAAGFSAVEIQFPYSLDSRLLNDELQKMSCHWCSSMLLRAT